MKFIKPSGLSSRHFTTRFILTNQIRKHGRSIMLPEVSKTVGSACRCSTHTESVLFDERKRYVIWLARGTGIFSWPAAFLAVQWWRCGRDALPEEGPQIRRSKPRRRTLVPWVSATLAGRRFAQQMMVEARRRSGCRCPHQKRTMNHQVGFFVSGNGATPHE